MDASVSTHKLDIQQDKANFDVYVILGNVFQKGKSSLTFIIIEGLHSKGADITLNFYFSFWPYCLAILRNTFRFRRSMYCPRT